MEFFLNQKKQLGKLKSEEDFDKIAVFGAGNGGVVHCVWHKATSTVFGAFHSDGPINICMEYMNT